MIEWRTQNVINMTRGSCRVINTVSSGEMRRAGDEETRRSGGGRAGDEEIRR